MAKRKPLANSIKAKTNPETINAVLNKKKQTKKKEVKLIVEQLSRINTHISSQLDTEMRIFIAKQKTVEKGYNIRKFLENAVADKLARETLAKM